jgi:hypothetical protein
VIVKQIEKLVGAIVSEASGPYKLFGAIPRILLKKEV